VVRYLRVPSGPGIRWDGGVEAGNEVALHYDPLIAKLIAWGENRDAAIARMRRALRELVIVGLPTSQAFHLRMLDDADFRRGAIDIEFLGRRGAALLREPVPAELTRPLAVAAAMIADAQRTGAASAAAALRAPGAAPWLDAARREGLRP
jgi:acetyl-CoA carboxylase biotin carboxylase subunit